jgi:hypothetical protein
VLTPNFGQYNIAVLPWGNADNHNVFSFSVFYWYPMVSFFLSLLASRIVGVMPIE